MLRMDLETTPANAGLNIVQPAAAQGLRARLGGAPVARHHGVAHDTDAAALDALCLASVARFKRPKATCSSTRGLW
jgi:hypothetical protein